MVMSCDCCTFFMVYVFSSSFTKYVLCFYFSFPVSLDWGGQNVRDSVEWFQYESDPTRNSNVFEVAQQLVQKYFPGEVIQYMYIVIGKIR